MTAAMTVAMIDCCYDSAMTATVTATVTATRHDFGHLFFLCRAAARKARTESGPSKESKKERHAEKAERLQHDEEDRSIGRTSAHTPEDGRAGRSGHDLWAWKQNDAELVCVELCVLSMFLPQLGPKIAGYIDALLSLNSQLVALDGPPDVGTELVAQQWRTSVLDFTRYDNFNQAGL